MDGGASSCPVAKMCKFTTVESPRVGGFLLECQDFGSIALRTA